MNISVIIPALNEATTIEKTLRDLLDRQGAKDVIVVDGGSHDETVNIANQFVRVTVSEKGRARQMNVGAAHATGDILLFLHSDTLLPEAGLMLILNAVRDGHAAGRFRMQFDDPRWLLKLYAMYTRFQMFSYGDQGFFMTRDCFDRLRGFREDVPFEDVDFYRRLRKETKPVILKRPVTTSARRFVKAGCLTQKFINLWLVGLYSLGFEVGPIRQKLYTDVR